MDNIKIQVSDQLVRTWENTPNELKNEITKLLEEQISQLIGSSSSKQEVKEYLTDLQEEMLKKD